MMNACRHGIHHVEAVPFILSSLFVLLNHMLSGISFHQTTTGDDVIQILNGVGQDEAV